MEQRGQKTVKQVGRPTGVKSVFVVGRQAHWIGFRFMDAFGNHVIRETRYTLGSPHQPIETDRMSDGLLHRHVTAPGLYTVTTCAFTSAMWLQDAAEVSATVGSRVLLHATHESVAPGAHLEFRIFHDYEEDDDRNAIAVIPARASGPNTLVEWNVHEMDPKRDYGPLSFGDTFHLVFTVRSASCALRSSNHLGVRWIEPGSDGTPHKPR